jgi:RNA-directed DNA polymerase
MSTAAQPMYRWNAVPWKEVERSVFKLQKRIYQASNRGDVRKVRKLQRLLMNSRSARLLAVRRVTQDNQGKKTAGVDGVRSLTAPEKLALSKTLRISGRSSPVRRVWIPKPASQELRPLGIPTMKDRALQALIKSALEPEWEARFEPNSYGFRPGRSCHDAIEAIFNAIRYKPKWVLDADIAKCFDRINHQELLRKINTGPALRRQIKSWLKAGIFDGGRLFPSEAGSPQGGTVSPLLANIALHGLETAITKAYPPKWNQTAPMTVRYADDFVIMHEDQAVINQCRTVASRWLETMGLELSETKTRLTHTLETAEGKPGFDFLGFHIRQFPAGKTRSGMNGQGKLLGFKSRVKPSRKARDSHVQKLRQTLRQHRHSEQALLIIALNRIIVGWTNYYAVRDGRGTFEGLQHVLYGMLRGWARSRHPGKSNGWIVNKYWRLKQGMGWRFQPINSTLGLRRHDETPKRKHVKVQGNRSPYDGDWVYWSARMGRHPELSRRVAGLLKRQRGCCLECELFFKEEDTVVVELIVPRASGGRDSIANTVLLHRHCRDGTWRNS